VWIQKLTHLCGILSTELQASASSLILNTHNFVFKFIAIIHGLADLRTYMVVS